MGKQALKIDTSLKQQQRLTPLQVQFVRLLEMSGPEMEEEVSRALDEMPALELAESEQDPGLFTTEDGEDFMESAHDVQRADFSNPDDVPEYLAASTPKSESSNAEGVLTRYDSQEFSRSYAMPEYSTQTLHSGDETLMESLESQLAEIPLSQSDRIVANYIIGSIDSNGYLTRSLQAMADDLAISDGIEVSDSQLQSVLDVIRTLDPPGVGARDLRECLILQLERRPRSTEQLTALEIVRHHFDLLSKRHFDRIASALDISRERLDDAVDLISRLNPKPGSAYPEAGVSENSGHISPDFLVEAESDGRLTLTSLSRVPKLKVDSTFDMEFSNANVMDSRAEAANRFIKAKRDDARNFIKVVKQRQQTIADVVAAIVKLQNRFFITENDEDIRPMVLRDIAAVTGYNLSVISRATQGKYIATVRGVYPLKKFFNEKVRADDDVITSNRIIAEIKRTIEKEDVTHPLSDREIASRLAEAGYDIARRTVAKYRESLGFPVARLRKHR